MQSRSRLISAFVALLLSVLLTSPEVRAKEVSSFDMPAQPLVESLRALASQTNLNVFFEPKLVAGRQAPALRAQVGIEDALRQLLAGSGLTYRHVDEKTFTIVAAATVSGSHVLPVSSKEVEDLRMTQSSSSRATGEERSEDQGVGKADQSSLQKNDEELEEIIVTARKTRERLQDVPISITVINGRQLEELGAVDVKDVLRSVPGLSFSDVERGQANYAIRGISTNAQAASPTVGIYLDDISLVTQAHAGAGAFDAILFDIERLEILKGPQGTLYGGSAMGGAIKYVSGRPNLAETSGSASAGMATTANGAPSYNAEGVVNFPIIPDVLAVRGGIYYLHEGGYVDNVAGLDIENTSYSSTPFPIYNPLTRPSLSTQSRDDRNFSDTYVGRLSLLWQPDPSWSIRPTVVYQKTTLKNTPYFFTNQAPLISSFRLNDLETPDRAGIYSLDVTKEFGRLQLTSLTAYFDRKTEWDRDYSFFIGGSVSTLFPNDSFGHQSPEVKTFTQELRLSSAIASGSPLKWTAGLYYSKQDDHEEALVNTFGGVYPGDLTFFSETKRDLRQYAVFGEVTYRITAALDFTTGVRLFKFEEDSLRTTDGPFAGGVRRTVLGGAKEDGVSPKFGISYKFNEDHLLYISATKGFRPGGATRAFPVAPCAADLALLGYDSAPTQFESDSLWTYEVGSKNELGDGRIMANGALFYSDWKNIQQGVTLPSCSFQFTANLGAARVQGAEFETRINLTPVFQIGGNAAFTDAEVTEGAFPSPAQEGDEVLDTPKWMASVFGSYFVRLNATWNLKIRADYQYRDGQRRQFATTTPVRFPVNGVYGPVNGAVPYGAVFQKDYDVLSAFVSLGNEETNVRLFVSNALDARPLLDTQLGGVSQSTTIRPRTIGLELRQQF